MFVLPPVSDALTVRVHQSVVDWGASDFVMSSPLSAAAPPPTLPVTDAPATEAADAAQPEDSAEFVLIDTPAGSSPEASAAAESLPPELSEASIGGGSAGGDGGGSASFMFEMASADMEELGAGFLGAATYTIHNDPWCIGA